MGKGPRAPDNAASPISACCCIDRPRYQLPTFSNYDHRPIDNVQRLSAAGGFRCRTVDAIYLKCGKTQSSQGRNVMHQFCCEVLCSTNLLFRLTRLVEFGSRLELQYFFFPCFFPPPPPRYFSNLFTCSEEHAWSDRIKLYGIERNGRAGLGLYWRLTPDARSDCR